MEESEAPIHNPRSTILDPLEDIGSDGRNGMWRRIPSAMPKSYRGMALEKRRHSGAGILPAAIPPCEWVDRWNVHKMNRC